MNQAGMESAVGSQPLQLVNQQMYYAVPITRFVLSENPHARIPRRVISVVQPAPITGKAVEQPYRFSQRPCQMGDRCINTYYKVQFIHQRCGIQKIRANIHPVGYIPAQLFYLLRLFSFLQADKMYSLYLHQGGKAAQGNASHCIDVVHVPARPDQTDLHTLNTLEPYAPWHLHPFRNNEIRCIVGDRVDTSLEEMR